MLKIPRKAHSVSGFTLMETLIVLALVATVLVVAVMSWRRSMAETAAKIAIESQANDLSVLNKAVRSYLRSPPSGWVSGTAYTIALSDLTAGGHLPNDFARRNGAVGNSPLNQPYVVRARIDPALNKAQAVIFDAGTPSFAKLDRLDIPTTADGILGVKLAVAQAARDNFKVIAATLPAGSSTATGVGNAWTKDVGAILGLTARPHPSAVALIGFADLEPDDSHNGAGRWKNCVQAKSVGNVYITPQTAVCPAGFTEVARWPFCGRENNYISPQYDVYPSEVGAITLGQRRIDMPMQIATSWQVCQPALHVTGCRNPDNTPISHVPVMESFTGFQIDSTILLNGAELEPDVGCRMESYMQGRVTFTSCDAWGSGGIPPYPLGVCARQTYSRALPITALRENAVNKLCCQESEP